MYFYEVYRDDGRQQMLMRDEPVQDWIGSVEKVMSEISPAKLGNKSDWFANVVDEVCNKLGMKRVVGPAVNIGDIRDGLSEARRQDYKP